jgi:tetratricopeptide (TPR) repeat protein
MESLRVFVSTHTDVDKSLTLLSDVMIKQGIEDKLDDILEDLNMQDHLLYAYIKARIAVAREDYDTAILLMESKQVLLSGNEQYYVYLAGLYQKTGKFEKAVTLYKRLVKVMRDNPSIWLGLAVSADGMSDHKVALLAFTKAQGYSYGNEIDEYVTRRVKFLSNQ